MYSKEIYKDVTQNVTKIREQTSKASSLHQIMKKVHINISITYCCWATIQTNVY